MATPGEMFLPAGDDPFGDIPIVAAQQAADVDPFADIPITATPAPELNPLLFNTAVATRQVGESLARVPGTIARMTDVPAITRGPPTPLSGLSVVARALQPLTEPVARFFAGETERLRQQFPGSVGEQGRDVERANAAFGAAFQGDFGPLREVITDPRAMGGYIGNALPSFAAAAMTGGSKSMIAALETAEIAKNAEEFTKKTGIEIGPEEFTKAVGVVGTINTAMERLGLGKVIQGQVGKSVVGKFFRTLLAGGFEGATESAQETTTNVATRAFIDPSQEPLEGVGAAALGGFGTGAAVSGARQLGPREAAPRSSPDDVAAALRSLGQFDDVTAAPLPAATAQSAQSAESAELPAGGRVVPVQRGGFGEAMEPAFEAVIPSGKGQTSVGVFPAREEAEQALRQREQRPALAPEQTLDGDEREVFTPDGRRSVRARFEVSEAPAVVASHNIQGIRNEAFPAELQPRDRERAASQVQIRSIVNSLRPELLGDARTSDAGAPLTFDGNVVSGNARTIALQSAYQQGKAGAYKDFLIKNAEKFGISAEVIRNMRAPILHRRVLGEDFDAAEFARLSNESSAARMSPAEQARVDARRLSAEDLQSFRPDESGNVLAATNQRFVQRFLASVGQNEAANLVNSRGEPNIKAAQRIQAAVFELAYGDQQLLELAAEEANPDVRNILGGLNQAAAAFARARAQNAELAEQVTRPIINAIERIRQSRQQGLSIEAVLGQRDIETGEASEDVQNVARFLDKNIRSAKRIGTALQAIAEITHDEAQGNKSGRLFGGEVAAEDIIDAGLERVSTSSEQSDLFAPKRGPVEITATLDETGEEVRVEVPAEVALRRAEKRLAMLKKLKRCVKR